jgi:LuxR family quorum-sensing system transcriptional regulator CciR
VPNPSGPLEPQPARLSPRQLDCLTRIAAGETSAEIAKALGISKRTVDHYIVLLCAKLGVRTRAQAVGVAISQRIIAPPSGRGPG